jgi:hypothetical protein
LRAVAPCCCTGAVTDNWPTIEPYFNETGEHIVTICANCGNTATDIDHRTGPVES